MTVGNYTLKTGKGETCLMAQMALQIRLTTPKADGRFIVQPQKTKTSGTCQETKANLNISFEEGFITFSFNKSVESNTVYVHAVSFQLSYPLTQTGPQKYKVNNGSVHLFAANIGHSYSCRNESVNMGQGLFLDISKDRMQAFNITKDTFGYSDPCPADQPDYRVAIAVGVTLLVLIVIVVIVYLLGRRRRTAGYQTL
ncbi:lysosome-associated membrane glycoprotein 1-like [Fundulus diaphanus]